MKPLLELIPLLLFSISAALTPGPNNLMLLNSGLQFGMKRSLSLYFGICLGFPLMVLIIALGFGAIFIQYAWLQQAFKILGSAYMLYLAYKVLTSHNKPKTGGSAQPIGFYKAILLQWVNPKAWLMGVSAIAMFTITHNPFTNAIALSLIFLLTCLPCVGAWLLFGAALQKILKEEHHRRWFNIAMAACLAASIALIFIE
jgi:threonine/homoserine/homoserine lactone efflux protein